ncbi:putative immunity protein [Arthrobacter sp. Ld5]|uniref:putative immunity protein n=1 Tax=Arthrobacter sp. Ld5 TaxID=649152 RepID=UPI003EBEB11F
MIFPAVRDPRLVSIRRGGLLSEADHQLLALWAATCAEHVLGLFEDSNSEDGRPRAAVEAARAWARGEAKMMVTRAIGGHAMGAARFLHGAPRFAAYASGQAACVAHVPEHDLGAAAYAIKAAAAAASRDQERDVARTERDWQRQQIPGHLRSLVLEDQSRRNSICWSVFDD